MDERICNLKVRQIEIDELFSYVARRPDFVESDDQERGEFYCYLSLDRDTKLIVNFHLGKRTGNDCRTFIEALKLRLNGERFQLSSDGYAGYTGHKGAVRRTFGQGVDYGTELKQFGREISFATSKARSSRKFNRHVCKWVKRTPRIGDPDLNAINISRAERLNLTMRLFNRRFTRCTLGYSKKLLNHRHAIAIFVCLYNFTRVHSAHKQTPAQAAKLIDHCWTVEEVLTTGRQ